MARCFGLGVVELPPNSGALLLDKVISMFYISVIETAVREIQGREEKKHQNIFPQLVLTAQSSLWVTHLLGLNE